MSGRAYRAQALAQLANSATFDHRSRASDMRQAGLEASELSEEDEKEEDSAHQLMLQQCFI